MSLVEAQEVEDMEEMARGMLEEKAQNEHAIKREQKALKITLEEVRRTTTPKKVM